MQGVPILPLAGIFLAIAALLFGVAYLSSFLLKRARQKRQDAMRAVAPSLRCSFSEFGEPGLEAQLSKLVPSFSKNAERAANLLRGERRGLAFETVDYSFYTGAGKSREFHQHTVVRVRYGLNAPTFHLRPENVFDKIGDWFGRHDIDFPHRPDFSARYFLRGEVEDRVRPLFTDEVIGLLEREPEKYAMSAGEGWLVIYRPFKTFVPADQLELHLSAVLPILAAFPGR